MRVVLLAAAALTFLTTGLSAQEARTFLGPSLGLNIATTGGSARTGVTAGFVWEHHFVAGPLIQTGLSYSSRPGDLDDQDNGTSGQAQLAYIEVPALLGFQFPTKNSSVQPFLLGGAQLGLNISCNIESVADVVVEGGVGCTDLVSGTDVSFVAGGGLAFATGRGSFTFSARYIGGLTDITENTGAKNRGFTVGISYLIPMGR